MAKTRGYFWLPDKLVDDHLRTISGCAVKVYLALRRHMGDKGTAFPSNARIAAMTGLSDRHIRNGLRELLECRLPKRCPLVADGGALAPNTSCNHGLLKREGCPGRSSLVTFHDLENLNAYPTVRRPRKQVAAPPGNRLPGGRKQVAGPTPETGCRHKDTHRFKDSQEEYPSKMPPAAFAFAKVPSFVPSKDQQREMAHAFLDHLVVIVKPLVRCGPELDRRKVIGEVMYLFSVGATEKMLNERLDEFIQLRAEHIPPDPETTIVRVFWAFYAYVSTRDWAQSA